MKRILVIEDDDNLNRGISFTFEKDGYGVVSANNITNAENQLAAYDFELILLDIGLPDGDGMELCKKIRKSSDVPIIMLTARDMETDEVSGLLAGADDYVRKPFSLSVLRARVAALLRRTEPGSRNILRSGAFKLDTGLCRLYKNQEEIPISATEYRLLAYLMANAGRVLSKEQILSALWDKDGNFVDENILPVNISRLRSKLETDPKNLKTIKTVHGIGYLWNEGE